MDMKLNHSDFSALFAKGLGIPLADAEAFTKIVFDTIVEGLDNDGSVKINGLGTFKVVDVESRTSVNVNTGERFEIKGHRKVSFLPAESLKETINAPFAMFEPVEVDDELVDDADDSANVVADDVADDTPVVEEVLAVAEAPLAVPVAEIEEEIPADTENVFPPAAVEYEEEMPIVPEEESVVEAARVNDGGNARNILSDVAVNDNRAEEGDCAEPAANDVIVEESPALNDNSVEVEQTVESSTPEANVEQPADVPVRNSVDGTHTRNSRNNVRSVYMILSLLLLLGAGVAGYFLMDNDHAETANVAMTEKTTAPVSKKIISPDKLSQTAAGAVEKDSSDTSEPQTAEVPAVQEQPDYQFVITDALAARNLSVITVADTADYKMSGSICEHKVEIDETLIKISLKHYGDKRLWPYIVAYNRMSRPNDLACGMVLKIPRLLPAK
jgi:nucleoid DNA-binding protein